MILLISYDLNQHEKPSAYTKVAEIIEQQADDSLKVMYSQWFVKTELSCDKWVELLKPEFDSNDRLLIVEVHRPYSGLLLRSQWDWLNKYL